MILQKMKYLKDGAVRRKTCGINELVRSGEFTFCGMAAPDSDLIHDEFEAVGDYFEGSLKQATCPSCKNFIDYIKRLS